MKLWWKKEHESLDGCRLQIKCLQKGPSANNFLFNEDDPTYTIGKGDVIMKLPSPMKTGGR